MATTPASAAGDGNGGTQCKSTYRDDGGSRESLRYFTSRKTIMEMLSDRGYDVPDSELTRSLPEFRAQFGDFPNPETLRISASSRSNPSKKGLLLSLLEAHLILVIFMGTDEVKVASIRSIFGQLVHGTNLNGLIMVLQSKMNSFARKELDKFPCKVEVFEITDLLVNISKHVLQPALHILTLEEKQQLLKAHSLKDKQLPQMLQTDAIAQYYGLEKGQVVKLAFAGGPYDFITYRCVM
ncbi:hypothetical protein Tsubulata_045622 [Turnera subulata]|uniref:RNA polymerase subunit H/Rpb5 C-terminal domain-containing protein n=1 Tax=Turnera subulata TaxID=218843 RepID=A0A9Q0G1G5_9ROSI|nr:hypothetical protein Tsubulata_045622 [Turnera subulata]